VPDGKDVAENTVKTRYQETPRLRRLIVCCSYTDILNV
jgi:hypothetical protein